LCAIRGFATLKSAMRRSHLPPAITALVCALAVASCGTASTPAVQLTLTAPTDGAVVSGGWVEVFGSVSPATATVDVSGKRAAGARGSFRQRLDLRSGVTHIRVVATAPGYRRATMHLAVRSQPARVKRPATSAVSQFVATINNLCVQEDAEATGHQSLAELEAQLTTGLAKVKALVPPRAIASAWASYLALVERQVGTGMQFLDALRARNTAEARRLSAQSKAIETSLHEKGKPLGLYAC
jgi:hypothetical protein